MEISVLIPTADRPGFLRDAILSVVNQSRLDLVREVIVSNNGIEDVSGVVSDFGCLPIIFVEQSPRLTAGQHFVWMINKAKCEWIAMLADDDMWGRYHLEESNRLRNKYPEAVAVFSQTSSVRNACRQSFAGYAELIHSFTEPHKNVFDEAFVFEKNGILLDALIRTPLNIWSMVGKKSVVAKHATIFADPNHGIDSDRYFVWRLNTDGILVSGREVGLFMRHHPQMSGTTLEKQDGARYSKITYEYTRRIIREAGISGFDVENIWRRFWGGLGEDDKETIIRQSFKDCIFFACQELNCGPLVKLKHLGFRNKVVRIIKDWFPPVFVRILKKTVGFYRAH